MKANTLSKTELYKRFKFFSYCLEIYKEAKGMRGKAVYELFARYGVDKFIHDCYEALHVEGPGATVSEIDEYISARAS